jgi:adenylyltransferase/sulfurtransferase
MNTVTPLELKSWLDNDPASVQLIDVREPEEHREFDIGGELMPLTEIHEHMQRIESDKKVVFYCKMGVRSMLAIQRIEAKLGLSGLYNLTGGLEAWKKEFGS